MSEDKSNSNKDSTQTDLNKTNLTEAKIEDGFFKSTSFKGMLIAVGLIILLTVSLLVVNNDSKSLSPIGTVNEQVVKATHANVSEIARNQDMPVYFALSSEISNRFVDGNGKQGIQIGYVIGTAANRIQQIIVTTQPVVSPEQVAVLAKDSSQEIPGKNDKFTSYLPPRKFVDEKIFYAVDKNKEWSAGILIVGEKITLNDMRQVARDLVLRSVKP